MGTHVNVDNFVRAETARMLTDLQRGAGGVNTFRHDREPAPIDDQPVIRLNRDTLYSFAVVDLAAGGTVTIPEHGGRYVSVMVVSEDHVVAEIFHGAGTFDLRPEAVGSRYALVAVRTLVDPDDPADVATTAALQDRYALECGSAAPYRSLEWDVPTLDETRAALLQLARGLTAFDRMFGRPDQVDPVRHLIGTAAGWGGLPSTEATYVAVDPRLPPGDYEMRFVDVPVDAFWSVSVYDGRGFFERNRLGRYTVNSVTGARDADGGVTVRFVRDDGTDLPNAIPTPKDWNLLVRLYRPRSAVLDGTWTVPELVAMAVS
ncbi:DUF1214 domain-containing protein [Cellulomonas sp. NPDC055163]